MNAEAPTHDGNAEGVVLSAVLGAPDEVFPRIVDIVRPCDFYGLSNPRIAGVIWSLRDEKIAIDVVTVARRLKELGHLDAVGGSAYLARLINEIPATVHVDDDARKVRDCAKARRIADRRGRENGCECRIAREAPTGTRR